MKRPVLGSAHISQDNMLRADAECDMDTLSGWTEQPSADMSSVTWEKAQNPTKFPHLLRGLLLLLYRPQSGAVRMLRGSVWKSSSGTSG